MIAKTEASGGTGLLSEVLTFTSSLPLDRQLLREDLVGSLAHLTMLTRQKIVPEADALAIRGELLATWDAAAEGRLQLPEEEDVHMAVEAQLTAVLGERAGLLHTARSRNDQVALDLRLRARAVCAEVLAELGRLLETLAARAEAERDLLLPAYTHRQRAQAITGGYLFSGYGAMILRDVEAFRFALATADVLPLGVGAIAGTSLPIDREVTRRLLAFARLSHNGLDTVGDRDFALDLGYAVTRCLLHLGRVATDFVDFSSQEFGFVRLGGEIACGSSMMPQKRNPDLFELIRAKSASAVGNLTHLMVLTKGLPSGYNRDLQDDRRPLLELGPLCLDSLRALQMGLAHVEFDRERCLAGLRIGYTQATDLAEALAERGVPFRTAYQAVGALVRRCQEEGRVLSAAPAEMAQAIHPLLNEELLKAATPEGSVTRKRNLGGTNPDEVTRQVAALRRGAEEARSAAVAVPSLGTLFNNLRVAPLR
jgi:argininosuccinate lyase